VLPSRRAKYDELYDTQVEGRRGTLHQADRERSLQRLMTINLLKRLESSVEAFRLTLARLQGTLDSTLVMIIGHLNSEDAATISDFTDLVANVEVDDDDFDLSDAEATVGKKVMIALTDMDLVSWQRDLAADQAIIASLHESMSRVSPDNDIKLQRLKRRIIDKVSEPFNEGNRKVLVFSAFADTVNYLYRELQKALLDEHGVQLGRVTGKDAPRTTVGKGYDFQQILTLFSPRSKDKALVMPHEPREIDVLIGTDCISEGQNLQDCDFVVNYDIHWNPVRIIQRFGRIDRIGSMNATIQLVNFWPDISLDEYINLNLRLNLGPGFMRLS